jgi:SAM-dependent methyltransferase
MQRRVTSEYVIPFLSPYLKKNARILEIGCAEAGVLKAFLDLGFTGTGIELNPHRVEWARMFLKNEIDSGKAQIINKNIYDIEDPEKELGSLFDLIVLKDVIEHIPDQNRFISSLNTFLKPGGLVFFAYPPWYMPFGGHQQICSHKLLRILPWIHLLPSGMYRALLSISGESQGIIRELMDIKETGVTIEMIKNMIRSNSFDIISEFYWWANPIYEYKFGIKPKRLWRMLSVIAFVRNVYTTAHYVLFSASTT